jgi:hypothetical protein
MRLVLVEVVSQLEVVERIAQSIMVRARVHTPDPLRSIFVEIFSRVGAQRIALSLF